MKRKKHFNEYIQSAEYKRYNANNRGTHTGDCVKRALSMAFDMDYTAVGKQLNIIMKTLRAPAWNIERVYAPFIKTHGGSPEYHAFRNPATGEPIDRDGIAITVDEWIDLLGQKGTYILETHNKPKAVGSGNHLTCVIDGKLFDSWDSRNQYVCGYYIVEGRKELELTNLEDHWSELIQMVEELMVAEGRKYIQKYSIPNGSMSFAVPRIKDGYTIYTSGTITTDDGHNKHKYVFPVAVVLSPTMTLDAAKKKLVDTVKVRVYDRFYAINKGLKDEAEATQLYKDSGYTEKQNLWMYGGREEKFFNSLPGWVKPFVTAVYVQSPGQYSDSYELYFMPIKGDPNPKKVYLWGYDSAMIREELDMYKKDFSRPGEDYSVSEL